MEWLVFFNRLAKKHGLPRDVKRELRDTVMRAVTTYCGLQGLRWELRPLGDPVTIEDFRSAHFPRCMHCSFALRWKNALLNWSVTWDQMCHMPPEINYVYGD